MANHKSTLSLAIFLFVILSVFIASALNCCHFNIDVSSDLSRIGFTQLENSKLVRAFADREQYTLLSTFHQREDYVSSRLPFLLLYDRRCICVSKQNYEEIFVARSINSITKVKVQNQSVKVRMFNLLLDRSRTCHAWFRSGSDHCFVGQSVAKVKNLKLCDEDEARKYEYIDVIVDGGERLLIDLAFRSKFERGSNRVDFSLQINDVMNLHAGNFSKSSPSLRYIHLYKLLRIEALRIQNISLNYAHLDPESIFDEFLIETGNAKKSEVMELIDFENVREVFDKMLQRDSTPQEDKEQFTVLRQVIVKVEELATSELLRSEYFQSNELKIEASKLLHLDNVLLLFDDLFRNHVNLDDDGSVTSNSVSNAGDVHLSILLLFFDVSRVHALALELNLLNQLQENDVSTLNCELSYVVNGKVEFKEDDDTTMIKEGLLTNNHKRSIKEEDCWTDLDHNVSFVTGCNVIPFAAGYGDFTMAVSDLRLANLYCLSLHHLCLQNSPKCSRSIRISSLSIVSIYKFIKNVRDLVESRLSISSLSTNFSKSLSTNFSKMFEVNIVSLQNNGSFAKQWFVSKMFEIYFRISSLLFMNFRLKNVPDPFKSGLLINLSQNVPDPHKSGLFICFYISICVSICFSHNISQFSIFLYCLCFLSIYLSIKFLSVLVLSVFVLFVSSTTTETLVELEGGMQIVFNFPISATETAVIFTTVLPSTLFKFHCVTLKLVPLAALEGG